MTTPASRQPTWRLFTLCLALLASPACSEAQPLKLPQGCVAAPGAKAGENGYADRAIHQKTGIELVLIPSGSFTMGVTDPLYNSDCQPAHHVTIAKPFYIAKTEVTNSQYRRFAATGYDGSRDCDPAYDLYLRHFRGKSYVSSRDDYPVVWVSWNNARAFCKWAGGLDLPSDAEWEYACRAGTTTLFYFGSDQAKLTEYAWTANSPGEGSTRPVAQLKPNAWGLYDMYGNAQEWVLDDWVHKYNGAPTDGSARYDGRMTKVLRGGSWRSAASGFMQSSACRYNSAPGNASNYIGFRVVQRPD